MFGLTSTVPSKIAHNDFVSERGSCEPKSPPAEGAPPEAPCPRHIFTLFGFTRATKYVAGNGFKAGNGK